MALLGRKVCVLPGEPPDSSRDRWKLGSWTEAEKKSLFWFALAVGLWATDFIHHTNPAIIGLGVGLMLSLPRIGVLDGKAIKQTNFLAIIFSAGAVSMGNVLLETNTLRLLTEPLLGWMQPLLTNPISYTLALYLGGFFYHFIFANRQSMLITSLPVLLVLAKSQGLDPVSLALLWTVGGGGGLFVYQSGVYVVGYSYGYFQAKDFFKVGVALTIVQGALLVVARPVLLAVDRTQLAEMIIKQRRQSKRCGEYRELDSRWSLDHQRERLHQRCRRHRQRCSAHHSEPARGITNLSTGDATIFLDQTIGID